MEAIARTFKSVWRTKRGFEVKDMGNHVVLFIFEDAVDDERVIMGEPWSYDKFLVSLQRLNKSVLVKELSFNMTRFWVQLHDLPIGDMNPRSACEIGKVIGEVQSGGVLMMAVASCGSECWWILQNCYVEGTNYVWRTVRLDGFDSDTKGCLTSVIGADY